LPAAPYIETCHVAATFQTALQHGRRLRDMPDVGLVSRRTLRTPDAADYCGSSASTFEKLRLTGGGPVYLKIGRRVVYRIEDLDAWLAANRRHSTSEKRGAAA
jgi:predicted DNA-binding transcriptional regulator AlpA